MSELMIPIPFRQLMNWLTTEYERENSVFGVHRPYMAGEKFLPIFGGEKIETPFGPAAGPNTQLAQNIVAAYFAGARFFELKTVQKMDGAELAACISRPCILAEDECYNCEWSTELTVPQAYEEYVKAWFACKILARTSGLGDPDGFVFNMSVGYDLEGIRGPKIDRYLNEMRDASAAPIFQECKRVLKEMFPAEQAFIDAISPRISDSVTVSTLHGCPPDEIERIASYLITEKRLHTFVKCNPTILGYESARSILDGMGYDYIAFDEHHFREDLQYADAIPMFRRLKALARAIRSDRYHVKAVKPLPRRKLFEKVPLIDCFTAPCKGGCPIGQDIPEYIELCRKGQYARALGVILEKNPLPFITGTICAHHCMDKCTRNFYDRSVQIRAAKLTAAERGYDRVLSSLKPAAPVTDGRRAAVIGGGPTGMAAAFFCGRAGIPVTLFEKEAALGGVVRHVIPSFRISEEAIEKDAALMRKMGVEVKLNTPAPTVKELKEQGYTHIFVATGAWKPGALKISGNVKPVIAWMRDVKAGRSEKLGHVAVVGGGNTAMDAARLALRSGAESSTLVYRRTRKYMPADAEELELAIADGVKFLELVSPAEQRDGKLICKKMVLGEPDASGRRSPVETDEIVEIPCDTVISAVGEKVDAEALAAWGIETDGRGCPDFKTNLDGVYTGGDVFRGPTTVVEGIADAAAFAAAVIGSRHEAKIPCQAHAGREEAIARKGILCESAKREGERCLSCNVVCQTCADVCPNRANVVVKLPDGRAQILHVDRMCNECGNCGAFCPYDSAPYKDKFTLFHDRAGFEESNGNQGFLPLGGSKVLVRLNGREEEVDLDETNDLPAEIEILIYTVVTRYRYLMG